MISHRFLVAEPSLSCVPGDSLPISVAEGELKVSVTEVDDGVEITNVSKLACVVFVRSPEGEQRFDLGIGRSVTVTGITELVEVGAVRR